MRVGRLCGHGLSLPSFFLLKSVAVLSIVRTGIEVKSEKPAVFGQAFFY
jgi:hypothetical protein